MYSGETVEGLRDGYGIHKFAEGLIYDGEWKMNKINGMGKMFFENGDLLYEGEWFDDEFNNFGTLYNPEPDLIPEGFDYHDFTVLNNLWTVYEGGFKLNHKDGQGILKLSNGENFTGMFKEDQAHGVGSFKSKKDGLIRGTW
jgi:hypothetical protein